MTVKVTTRTDPSSWTVAVYFHADSREELPAHWNVAEPVPGSQDGWFAWLDAGLIQTRGGGGFDAYDGKGRWVSRYGSRGSARAALIRIAKKTAGGLQ